MYLYGHYVYDLKHLTGPHTGAIVSVSLRSERRYVAEKHMTYPVVIRAVRPGGRKAPLVLDQLPLDKREIPATISM